MKTILVFAAFALAAAASHQAFACDYHAHAAAQNATVVACAGDTCTAEQQTSEQKQPE
jgi:hypothetical protein